MVTFIFRDRVVEALKEGIYQSMELYGKETQSNYAVDFLQSKVGLISSKYVKLLWSPHSNVNQITQGQKLFGIQ